MQQILGDVDQLLARLKRRLPRTRRRCIACARSTSSSFAT